MQNLKWIPIFILLAMKSYAASNSAVLPKGIWHPSIRYGIVSEVSNQFDNTGSLQSIGRLNQAFDGQSLEKQVASFSNLTKLLKETYPNSRYAEQLYVGALEFEAQAAVQYTAPVLAYGASKRLTLAAGVPIVSLKGSVSARQTGVNNTRAIRNQISSDSIHEISPELNDGLTSLENANLVSEYERILVERGYIVPRSVNRTVVGDVQLAGVYQYWENARWTFSEQTILNLPTGPEDNPDDFLDIPIFHQTYLKFDFKQDYRLTSVWSVGTIVGYTWKLPDTALKRVPKDEDDVLPEADRKERVSRNLGDIISVGGTTNYWIFKPINLAAGYDYSYKTADTYSGSRGYNYSLLSRNSESDWHRVFGTLTYSTVDLYFTHQAAIPFIVSYTYSDIIQGTNIDRQLNHELSLKMFF